MRDLGLTFAGGGNRSFYQQGLLEVWGERLWPRVSAVTSCSAGAAMAILQLSGRAKEARSHWDGLRKGLRKNLDPLRLLSGEDLAPHGPIYRSTMLEALREGGFERFRAQPFPIYMLCSVPPTRMPIGISVGIWLGLAAYGIEKRLKPRMLHPTAGARLGFREFLFDARDCETPEELADLVLASSSTPPFTPVGRFRGTALLDGGLIDNAPAFAVEREPAVRKNLVLLTRYYPEGVRSRRGSRLYIAPTEPVPARRWDYTEHAPVDETIALGRRDAERHALMLERWLAEANEAENDVEAEEAERATA